MPRELLREYHARVPLAALLGEGLMRSALPKAAVVVGVRLGLPLAARPGDQRQTRIVRSRTTPMPQETGDDAADEGYLDPLGPNAACYVCHVTFVDEPLAVEHLQAKITCIDCHGTSQGHANDEDIGATPPDIVIKRPQVNRSCRKCHKGARCPP